VDDTLDISRYFYLAICVTRGSR